jgi:hypothetical protein
MAQDKYRLDHYEDLGDQAAESVRFHDEFEAPPTPHLQKGVYSDGRGIGGHWGVEGQPRRPVSARQAFDFIDSCC